MTTVEPSSLDSLPLIFAACVSSESSRYGIDKPFVRDGYVCATDGRIAVRMKTQMPSTPGSTPKIEDLNWNKGYKSVPIDLPNLGDEPKDKKCSKCDGIGRADFLCDKCDGYGDSECFECGHEKDCVACDGLGKFVDEICEECNGGGSVAGYSDETIMISTHIGIRNRAIWLLRRFNICCVYINTEESRVRPVRFTLGEIEGLLMPAFLSAEVK